MALRAAKAPLVILVDDARSFSDGRPCHVARTPGDAVELLRRHEFDVIDQLWLDHDLGWSSKGSPLTARPVVDELVQNAQRATPYRIGEIRIHGGNPADSVAVKLELQGAGYRAVRDYHLRALRIRP